MKKYDFSSDTTAPVCPEIMKILGDINFEASPDIVKIDIQKK